MGDLANLPERLRDMPPRRVELLMRELAAAIREEIGALPTGVSTLAEEMRRARVEARMSLQEVADAAGLSKSHVWEVEQGRSRNPTISMVHGLSRALGVPFLRLAQAALNTQVAATPTSEPASAGPSSPAPPIHQDETNHD